MGLGDEKSSTEENKIEIPMKVKIHVKKNLCGGALINEVHTIQHKGEETKYAFPENLQGELIHVELFKLSNVKAACKNMTKPGHFRNLIITLPDEVRKLYMDEDNNFVFNSLYLEEYVENKEQNVEEESLVSVSGNINELQQLVAKLQTQIRTKELSLSEIEKKFILEKFTGKTNAAEWIENFEIECQRNHVTESQRKIQCLRLFLDENAKEWYSSTYKKVPLDKWEVWKDSFLKVYSDRGWSNVRYAYEFRYLNGSMMDYALKKERLLLECEKGITSISCINHIVVGLPVYIQDKLDKEEIKTTDHLFNQIKRYDGQKQPSSLEKNKNYELKKPTLSVKKTDYHKKPCYMCAALGHPNRYHPLEVCRSKQRYKELKEVNFNEEDGFMKIELENDNQKNC